MQSPPPQSANQWQPCPQSLWQPQVHVTTADTTTSPNWLLDSGASHHVTSNLANISKHKPYEGTNDIVISDGTGLPILHISLTTLSTPSHTFSLSNVLGVPTMKKNLISISPFVN